ncbi:MAG: hypothetical protein IPG04_16160 [Polyangiaceae bacterium]|nr:hypothetical protein [Polyangiaceae bacterium]
MEERGQRSLGQRERCHFYVTNDFTMSAEDVVREANDRCNQENVLAQLKSGVRALRAPLNTLNANWAYMVIASIAWSLKAWFAPHAAHQSALARSARGRTRTRAAHGVPVLRQPPDPRACADPSARAGRWSSGCSPGVPISPFSSASRRPLNGRPARALRREQLPRRSSRRTKREVDTDWDITKGTRRAPRWGGAPPAVPLQPTPFRARPSLD